MKNLQLIVNFVSSPVFVVSCLLIFFFIKYMNEELSKERINDQNLNTLDTQELSDNKHREIKTSKGMVFLAVLASTALIAVLQYSFFQ